MSGYILFYDLEELAEFLRYFTPSTAVFECERISRGWILTFTGGC